MDIGHGLAPMPPEAIRILPDDALKGVSGIFVGHVVHERDAEAEERVELRTASVGKLHGTAHNLRGEKAGLKGFGLGFGLATPQQKQSRQEEEGGGFHGQSFSHEENGGPLPTG